MVSLSVNNKMINETVIFVGPRVHVLKCSTAGKPLWETVVMSPGIALAGNR